MRVRRTLFSAQAFGQEVRGGVAFGVRVGGEQHFAHRVFAHAFFEFAHAQFFGADAVHRRERAAEYEVAPAPVAAAFDGGAVGGFFDRRTTSCGRVCRRCRWGRARRRRGRSSARTKQFRPSNGARASASSATVASGAESKKKREPRGGFFADAGQPLQVGDEPLERQRRLHGRAPFAPSGRISTMSRAEHFLRRVHRRGDLS